MERSIKPYLTSFGRNRGRTLRPYQQSLVDGLLPKISPPSLQTVEGDAVIQLKNWVDGLLRDARHADKNLALEIGFGGGEHLLAQAEHNPDTLFIGCEPFINGVAKCLVGIEEKGLTNIRLFTNDARLLIDALPDACLDSAFILFPDPWPKIRHHKRRLVNHDTLARLARAHKPGGRLLIATDHEDYSVWILEHLQTTPHYRWMAERAADFTAPPSDWTQTKYQRKTTAEGRAPVFMECVRTSAISASS